MFKKKTHKTKHQIMITAMHNIHSINSILIQNENPGKSTYFLRIILNSFVCVYNKFIELFYIIFALENPLLAMNEICLEWCQNDKAKNKTQ